MELNQKLKIKYKIWLENEEGLGVLGDGKWELLKMISATGSLKESIDAMGWRYRSTWNRLRTIEKRLGFQIIERGRGGSGGGGFTRLTPEGEKMVEYFHLLHDEVDQMIEKPVKNFLKKINELNRTEANNE